MTDPIDILVLGSGSFAARILFDLAATTTAPLSLAIAGRNRDRLDWLRTAANARAHMFGRPIRCLSRTIDLLDADATAELLQGDKPSVVVQAASLQPGSVISATGDAWSQLVAEGGLSATAVFQARLSIRVARALRSVHPTGRLINCCFPDVVNSLIAAAGLPIACGIGNVAILAHAFAGALPDAERCSLKVLAHYQTIGPWRRPKQERTSPLPRVWIGETEISDVLGGFAEVRLTPEPVIDISGASGVPLIQAMALGIEWVGACTRAERVAGRLSGPIWHCRHGARPARFPRSGRGCALERRVRDRKRARRRRRPRPVYRQALRPAASCQPAPGRGLRRCRGRCGV